MSDDEILPLDDGASIVAQLGEMVEAFHAATGVQPSPDEYYFLASVYAADRLMREMPDQASSGAVRVHGFRIVIDPFMRPGEIHFVRPPDEDHDDVDG